MIDFIIYHKNCPDGFCAAFVAKKLYPNAELFGATHGELPPNIKGKNVLMLDFSYSRNTLLQMEADSNSIRVLDHHKTAEKELEGISFATFDMHRSGAGITWDVLFPGKKRPWYVDYVEDRDLWNWNLPDSKEISGYIMALPTTLEAWSILDSISTEEAAMAGYAIRLHIDHYINGVVAEAQSGIMEGYKTGVVNAPYLNISDVCNKLCDSCEIALGYFERHDSMIQFSLRSVGDLDVSVIAKKYGGGGHKNASGFQLTFKEGRALIDTVLGR
jgi:oligoribonuclease NrnB/cAMP/cGMP phosphodiesterase (DHH superfamily)